VSHPTLTSFEVTEDDNNYSSLVDRVRLMADNAHRATKSAEHDLQQRHIERKQFVAQMNDQPSASSHVTKTGSGVRTVDLTSHDEPDDVIATTETSRVNGQSSIDAVMDENRQQRIKHRRTSSASEVSASSDSSNSRSE
jgi:hypothetical protein